MRWLARILLPARRSPPSVFRHQRSVRRRVSRSPRRSPHSKSSPHRYTCSPRRRRPDWEKAAQLEGGTRAVVVPKMIYRLGLFRAPRGSSAGTGPETHEGSRHTAVINVSPQGSPTVQVIAEWRFTDGQWKLANKSLCSGITTLSLPIPCSFS